MVLYRDVIFPCIRRYVLMDEILGLLRFLRLSIRWINFYKPFGGCD